MDPVRIYHNPRCSKSRETLAILQEKGIEPIVIEYLKETPNTDDIKHLLSLLKMSPRELMRQGEEEYKHLQLNNTALTDAELIQALVEHPRLIERPIVVVGSQARIGRPPHTVLEIL